MDLLSSNCFFSLKSYKLYHLSTSQFSGCYSKLCTKVFNGYGNFISAFATQNHSKKSRKRGKLQKTEQNSLPFPEINNGIDKPSPSVEVEDGNEIYSSDTAEVVQTSIFIPSRSAVLQACTVTSGFIGALGVLIRQVSHIASRDGWPIVDCSADITFSFQSWHLGLIIGSVILVSSSRFLLLKSWPDFAESSEAANQQVLTSLEPLDYLIVAFLPGISEELLFRGSLLPLFGINWTSILAVAALFGVLHLGGGRNYSFAIWATLVGVVYGYATILSFSITVPMASHALNNLVACIIWQYSSSKLSKE